MNKTIINFFTYLVIFLAITQIINYLFNEIYGSLIFFLILSIGLYFITKKNLPISLLLTIVITNILNVSDILDNNLYEGLRDRVKMRLAQKAKYEADAEAKKAAMLAQQEQQKTNNKKISDITRTLDDLYDDRKDAREELASANSEYMADKQTSDGFAKSLENSSKSKERASEKLSSLNAEIDKYTTRLAGIDGAPIYPDPHSHIAVLG